jgi:hypothetical protein
MAMINVGYVKKKDCPPTRQILVTDDSYYISRHLTGILARYHTLYRKNQNCGLKYSLLWTNILFLDKKGIIILLYEGQQHGQNNCSQLWV